MARSLASTRLCAAAIANALADAPTAPSKPGHDRPGRHGAARFGRRSEAVAPAASVPSSASEAVLAYPRAPGGVGCLVRSDGTCVLKWPGGAVAANVEREEASPLGYRLSAAYPKNGKIACAFDGRGGGFAYRPDGSLLLTHQPNKGGMLMDASGGTLRAWDGQGKPVGGAKNGASGRIAVPLGDCMALLFTPPSASASSADAPPDPKGDAENASGSAPRVSLAFRCDGFQHIIHQSANLPSIQWDPTLDGVPAVSGLHASSKPKRRAGGVGGGGALGANQPSMPASLAARGGPAAGLSGIADALALLPDLGVGRTRALPR